MMNSEHKNTESFNDLIISFLSGNASQEEIGLLRDWINQSAENKSEFIKIRTMWMATAQIADNDPNQINQKLRDLNHKIDLMNHYSQGYTSRFRINKFLKIAASVLIIFSLGSLLTYLLFIDKPLNRHKLVSFYVSEGAKAMTVLPDGTQVWINAKSNLSYDPQTYGERNRQVTLIGEAFFKVVSNAKKPFTVKAKNLNIKAVGTEFNVKAYPEENTVETTLVKGIVKIEGEDQQNRSFSITMLPKQKVTFSTGKAIIDSSLYTNPANLTADKLNNIKLKRCQDCKFLTPVVQTAVNTDLSTSWKDDRWIFKGEEIGDLAILIERRYNVTIHFHSEELKHYKFTGTFKNETLEQVMQVVQLTAPLQYQIGKGKVDLTIDPVAKLKYEKLFHNN
ncbi:MAG: FecR family protein [Bacteroidota bacterium]|nr:FecR family protein [Bacteroidota bacterium]